jgi:hypothetical protein
MKNFLIVLFVIISSSNLLFSPLSLYAQEVEDSIPPKQVLVTLVNGTERIGVVLQDDGREILLNTEILGKIYIPKTDIKSIKEIQETPGKILNGEYYAEEPFSTRYYFTTNALPIKKGENYTMIHLYGPEVHFSLSNRFSVGLMATWFASPIAVALKYTIPTANKKINFGVGTITGSSGYLNNFRGFGGLHWGMVTFGDRQDNITISAGFSYFNPGNRNEWKSIPGTYYPVEGGYYVEIPYEYKKSNAITSPVISIAAIKKVGVKASFIFDSMLFFAKRKDVDRSYTSAYGPSDESGYAQLLSTTVTAGDNKTTLFYLMPGMRFHTSEKKAFQVSLAGVSIFSGGDVTSIPIPMCAWLMKF